MRRDLPSGTVTFLFTDVEGSTRLLDELGAEKYAECARRASPDPARCVRRQRRRGGGHPRGRVLRRLPDCARCAGDLGDVERVRLVHEDNLRRARAQPNPRFIARSLGQLALLASDEGRVEDAVSMLQESLRIRSDLDDRLGIADDFGRLARTLALAGKAETAARLAAVRTQLDEAALAEERAEGAVLTLDEAVALALDA